MKTLVDQTPVRSARLAAVLTTTCLALALLPARAAILESMTNSITLTPEGTAPTTVTSNPTPRAGTHAFRFAITNSQERSEVRGGKARIAGQSGGDFGNGEYWYGWSTYLPSDFPIGTGNTFGTMIAQWHVHPPASGRVFGNDCGGGGSFVYLNRATNNGLPRGTEGKMTFMLQRTGGSGNDVLCTQHELADISAMRGQWTDIVMHVKWTGTASGFLRVWVRVGGAAGTWVQKIDHTGATFWEDEGTGPYFKMGVYVGDPGNGSRTVFTDEYRLGDHNSNGNEVAPGGNGPGSGGGATPAKFSIAGSAVTASAHDGNVPANTVDGSLSTRWSANGDGQWIRYDLGATRTVSYVKIAFYNGNTRTSTFDIQTSDSSSGPWTTRSSRTSSGTTTALETFDFTDVSARYVRILGHGNSQNTWNSYTEVEVWGL
jgi:hypothetical protein